LWPRLRSTLFPYTTLFRSRIVQAVNGVGAIQNPDFDTPWVQDLLLDLRQARTGWAAVTHLGPGRERRGCMRRIGAIRRALECRRSEEHTSELQSREKLVCR